MPRLSPDQKAARKLGLGASDIAEMIGISPYQGASPVRLWAEKRGLLDDSEEDESLEMRLGHALEGPLVRIYQEESGYQAKLSGEYVESVVHPEYPWARCNLDGRVIDQNYGLEVKHVGIGMSSDWDLLADDGIPHYVRCQCAWQCLVASLDQVHTIGLVAGRFRVFYVDRDLELEGVLFNEARQFWQNVVDGVQPPIDGSEASRALLEKLYPSPPAPVIADADDDITRLLDMRVQAAEAESHAKERKEIVNNQIKEWLGMRNATEVSTPTAKGIWSQSKDGNRPLRVTARGDAKKPRIIKPNAKHLPELIDIDHDGEVF